MLLIAMFFFLFVPSTSVNAACDYARQVELATYAANVNATYEINEIVLDGNNNIVTEKLLYIFLMTLYHMEIKSRRNFFHFICEF